MTAFNDDLAKDKKNPEFNQLFNRAYLTIQQANAYDDGFADAEDYWRPKEREAVIEAFAKFIGHQNMTHSLGSHCWFCNAVESIE